MTDDLTTPRSGDPTGAAEPGRSTDGRSNVSDRAIALPITAVTCLEDRAQVLRSARLELSPGTHRLRLGPITALAVDRSLRAELTTHQGGPAAKVVDARINRVWTPVEPGAPTGQDPALEQRIHRLTEQLRAGELRRQRLTSRLAVLDQLAADLLRDIAEGAGSGEAEPARWSSELDRVGAERESYGEQLAVLRAELGSAREEQQQAVLALDASAEPPTELTAHVELIVEVAVPGAAELQLSHLVPCALWRPAYRATAGPGNTVRLESDAMVWQRTGEDWHDVRLTLSTARPTLAADPPRLVDDVLMLRERSSEERRTVEVDLREEAISTVGADTPRGSGELPGVDDGGEVRVLVAPSPTTVPSDGRAHRVALTSFTASASLDHVCTPELSPLVTQVLRFGNAAGHPLLTGPVDLVRGSGFVGRGELRFTAVGAEVSLPLGSEDGFRVVRQFEEVTGTSGLSGLGQRTVRTRTVRLYLSRFSGPEERDSTTVTLRERIPVSEVSAVEVRLNKDACSPHPDGTDAEGVVRWEIPLAPGARSTVTLVYEISATSKVAGL